jgi:hypothetical protein
MWEATVSAGDFRKEVKSLVQVKCNPNSQFYDMIVAEENFHKGQHEGTTSTILADLWNANTIIQDVLSQNPFVGVSEAEAKAKADQAVRDAIIQEERRSLSLFLTRECDLEREAKTAAHSSHRVSLKCTYPSCPN